MSEKLREALEFARNDFLDIQERVQTFGDDRLLVMYAKRSIQVIEAALAEPGEKCIWRKSPTTGEPVNGCPKVISRQVRRIIGRWYRRECIYCPGCGARIEVKE